MSIDPSRLQSMEMGTSAVTEKDVHWQMVISRDTIRERIREVAREISEDFAGKEPVFIGVLNGAVFFLGDLVREMTIPCRIDFIKAASYGSEKISSGHVRLTKDMELDVRGKPLILVEDIVDTGLTLKYILPMIEQKSPALVRVCALIDKRERRQEEIHIDYTGFRVESGFLVGYGLDWGERYRHLPDIYALD
ncbi:MAG: hypoxanthine phosphoribosyltransferase [Desulfobacteraceae bacterium]|jgi:hypoxanthine phosphoribosyltransferase